MPASENKDQQHPLWQSDRAIVNTLLAAEPTDYNLAELGAVANSLSWLSWRKRYPGRPRKNNATVGFCRSSPVREDAPDSCSWTSL